MINGAESLVRTARAAGIDVCFANPGTTEMPLVLALEAERGIRTVLCLFEGVVTGAADGYGRMARKPALTLLHLGPGFANGIAYLHDARRARSPIVNLIGEHATWHISADAPLNSDIESLARPVSAWLHRNRSSEELAGDTARAVSAASGYPGRIATLIVPHDAQIGPASGEAAPVPSEGPAPVDRQQIATTIDLLRSSRKPLLFLGGEALSERGLLAARKISDSSGCGLMSETFPKRLERGGTLPGLPRLPYFPEAAMEALAPFDTIILCGALEPVSFFGYPGLPSYLIDPDKQRHTLATPLEDVQAALDHGLDHFAAQVLIVIGGRNREVAFLVARTIAQVVAFAARIPAALFGVDEIESGVLVLIETDVVEDEEFRFRAKKRGVADAAVLEMQFRFLGDPARIALVMLFGDRIDHVAQHDERGDFGEGIHHRGLGVGNQEHVALVDGGPASNARAIHAESLFKRAFLQMLNWIGNVMLQARDIGESQIELLGIVLFGKFQDFFRAHPSSMQVGFRTVGMSNYRAF